jgi:hypothetical protein
MIRVEIWGTFPRSVDFLRSLPVASWRRASVDRDSRSGDQNSAIGSEQRASMRRRVTVGRTCRTACSARILSRKYTVEAVLPQHRRVEKAARYALCVDRCLAPTTSHTARCSSCTLVAS